jgi:hypothetical protein
MLQGMKEWFVIACLLCVSVLVTAQGPALSPANIPVTIQVNDESGAVVAHAQVRLDPPAQNAPGDLTTDAFGRLSLSVKPGTYTITVSEPGFETASQRMGFVAADRDTQSAPQTLSITLRVARLHGLVAYSGDSLILTGDPSRAPIPNQPSIVLTPIEFHALPHVTVTVHNSHINGNETYSGVPLATLLAKIDAPIGSQLRGDAMTTYIIATGSDGYAVVLSLAEADPEFHENQVIVADARDGQPLGKNGPFQLIVPGDKRPARWVHNLVSITLNRAE